MRDTPVVLSPGASRQQLARRLNAAYAHGLLSENTLSHRLDLLFGSRLVDPVGLVGDLTRGAPRRRWATAIINTVAAIVHVVNRTAVPDVDDQPRLLALDWSGGAEELLLGRHADCDVLLSHSSVSRRHARLVFRDGSWVIQDLESTNGTTVNGVCVGRCELRPGDDIALGDEHLRID